MRDRPSILAVSSGGGHWVQLLRATAAFDDLHIQYVTVDPSYREDVPGRPFRTVNDATRWDRVGCAVMALRMLLIVLLLRPDVVVTTGAAPGYFALRFGRWFGARTIWLDSIANVETMSMAGRLARPHADLWLTQWTHLARPDGPECAGAVL